MSVCVCKVGNVHFFIFPDSWTKFLLDVTDTVEVIRMEDLECVLVYGKVDKQKSWPICRIVSLLLFS